MDVRCHLDAAFHMIFHGIVVDVMELVSNTLKRMGIRTEVAARVAEIVKNVRDLHHVELPFLPFKKIKNGTDPFGMSSWMGSQKVAFSRLLHLCFSCTRDLVRVKYSRPDQNDKLNDAIKLCTMLERVTGGYSAFVCRVMVRVATPKTTMELKEYVKLFLSSYTRLEIALRSSMVQTSPASDISPGDGEAPPPLPHSTSRKRAWDPKWLSTGNFPSLLNLHWTIEEFGPIRLFWDASDERLVQRLKPRCRNMAQEGTQTWKRTALQFITNAQILDMVVGRGIKESNRVDVTMYETKEKLLDRVKTKSLPMLLYELKGDSSCFKCFYKLSGDQVGCLNVTPNHALFKHVGSVSHVAMDYTDSKETFERAMLSLIVKICVLSIPNQILTEDEEELTYSYLTDMDWLSFSHGKMCLLDLTSATDNE